MVYFVKTYVTETLLFSPYSNIQWPLSGTLCHWHAPLAVRKNIITKSELKTNKLSVNIMDVCLRAKYVHLKPMRPCCSLWDNKWAELLGLQRAFKTWHLPFGRKMTSSLAEWIDDIKPSVSINQSYNTSFTSFILLEKKKPSLWENIHTEQHKVTK